MTDCTRRDAIARIAFSAAAAALLVLPWPGGTPACAADKAKVEVRNAWARPSLGKTGRSAAYFSILNQGAGDDRLVAAKGKVAGRIELHKNIRDGDVMRMRPLPDGVAVPAEKTVTFAPAGMHVMLIGLKKPLQKGDSFPLTLVFEKAGDIDVDVTVSMTAPDGGMHHGQ